ncbi:MAG: tRNA (adenosine(37)-N6)-threonylcarbamoyltransferase complex dimerization subunit type 1 TsaB [Chloroflexota bacterium]
MLLAIDTATRMLSLAVHDGNQILAEQTWQAPNNHTEILAPAIDTLATHAGVSLTDLTALAVVHGPGSYTGVRIGVAMAKGLAAARGLPVVGVTTLDAVAAGQPKHKGTLIAIVSAGRGRVIAGRYRWTLDDGYVPRGGSKLLKWAELFETIDSEVTLAGEINERGWAALDDARTSNLELNVHFADPAHSLRRAGFVAKTAWARLNAVSPSDFDAAKIVPLYMNTID